MPALAALLLLALTPLAVAGRTSSTTKERAAMFDEAMFAELDFLVGRWVGSGPDGKLFYEEYDRPESRTVRSRRFKDATFAEASDGSSVSLNKGVLTSTWGEFTWKAVQIDEGLARFEPINAPSSFSWKRIGPDTLEVTQNWTDEAGKAQSYSIPLRRVTK